MNSMNLKLSFISNIWVFFLPIPLELQRNIYLMFLLEDYYNPTKLPLVQKNLLERIQSSFQLNSYEKNFYSFNQDYFLSNLLERIFN